MKQVRTAIIYYSSTGTNHTLAKWAAESAEQAGSEVRLRKVQELAPQEAVDSNPLWRRHVDTTQDIPVATLADLEWADAIIFSAPTRYGSLPSQLRQFLDLTGPLWAEGKLANKVVTAMSSAMNPHGGQESTILSLYTTMYHWGAIVVAPGYTNPAIFKAGGNPYGTSVSVDQEANMVEDVHGAVKHQAERVVQVASWIKNGLLSEPQAKEKSNEKNTAEEPTVSEPRTSERPTPIIDGDARPDINLHPEEDQSRNHPIPTPQDQEKAKTTTNRVDTNSLEDFRDAK
jgi:NAD(P)H dehydrogenase (quinone)